MAQAAHVNPALSPRRRRLFTLLLVLQLLLVPVLLEVALALFWPVEFRKPVPPGIQAEWASLVHRRSAVPGLAYELNTGFDGEYRGMRLFVNALGFRGPTMPREKPSGTVRIAAVGDSVTFGWNLAVEEAWPQRLAARLQSHVPPGSARRYEALNFGVGGYGTRDEAIIVRAKALPLDPDLVIVAWHPNDPETEPLQPLHRWFHQTQWWERSQVLRLLAGGRRQLGVARLGGGDEYRYLNAPRGRHWPSVLAAFDDMRAACAERGIRVVVVAFPSAGSIGRWADYDYHDIDAQVLGAAAERGFATLDIEPVYEKSGHGPRALYSDAEHPNALGLDLAAQAMEELLMARHQELLNLPPP